MILDVENILFFTDEIKVSYFGNEVLTLSGKVLNTFSDLSIKNSLQERFVLPSKIEAEAFIEMQGFTIEPTTDIGGGYNLGYANPGDYADYLIYCHNQRDFKVSLRVASLYSNGSFGFYLLNGDSTETELFTVNVTSTGGWQKWATISENTAIPKGKQTLRIKALSGEYNLNWFKFEAANGIKSNDMNSVPIVYPNPVLHDKLNIKFEDQSNSIWQIDLFSLDGKLIRSQELYSDIIPHEFDISNIPRGIYALRLRSEDSISTCKIIRQ
jgi:hypothetical protein